MSWRWLGEGRGCQIAEWLPLFVPSTLVLWNQDQKNECFVCSRLRDPGRCLRVWKHDLSVQAQVNYFSPGCIILPSAWVKVKHCSPQYLIVDMTFTLTCARGACETYHQVMKEKLPGLTQLLVEQHVKEVVDEVTCGEKKTFRKHLSSQFRFSFDQPKRDRFLWQWELWVHQVCRVDPASMATANQDVSRRGSIHICWPRPFPPTGCTHGDSYSEGWKNNEVLRMGTKGCRRAQGFGGMGINRIMEGNLTPGSVFPLLCNVSHQTWWDFPPTSKEILTKRSQLHFWLVSLYHVVSMVDHIKSWPLTCNLCHCSDNTRFHKRWTSGQVFQPTWKCDSLNCAFTQLSYLCSFF